MVTELKRRQFIRGAAAISAGILVERGGSLARSSKVADSRIEVLLGEEIGTISPTIYGHFAEHLGGVVYDGIWVGQNSRVPNTGGIRTALVDALKRIKAPVIRWPGGCFAVRGARASAAQARVLSMPDVHAHNTFENPNIVQPRNEQATVAAGVVSYRFAPASVTRLQISLD